MEVRFLREIIFFTKKLEGYPVTDKTDTSATV